MIARPNEGFISFFFFFFFHGIDKPFQLSLQSTTCSSKRPVIISLINPQREKSYFPLLPLAYCIKAINQTSAEIKDTVPPVTTQLPLVTASLCSAPMRPYEAAVAMTLKLTPVLTSAKYIPLHKLTALH